MCGFCIVAAPGELHRYITATRELLRVPLDVFIRDGQERTTDDRTRVVLGLGAWERVGGGRWYTPPWIGAAGVTVRARARRPAAPRLFET